MADDNVEVENAIEEVEASFKLLKKQGIELRKRSSSKELQQGDQYLYCCLFKDFKDWETETLSAFSAQVEQLKSLDDEKAKEFYDDVLVPDYEPQIATLVSFITDALDNSGRGRASTVQFNFSRSNRNINNSEMNESREVLLPDDRDQ